MNVTFSYFSLTPGSGIPNVCVNLANAASALEDVRASLIALSFQRDDVAEQVTVRRLKENPRGAYRLFTSWPLRPVANHLYRRAMRDLKPDWVVVNYCPLDAYAIRFRERLGYRVVYYYHNVTDPKLYEGEERSRREKEEAAMLTNVAQADLVFTNSDFTRARVREATGRDATAAPPAADRNVFRPDPAAKAHVPTLLHVGRVVRHKGVDQLLEAFAKVREKHADAALRVVGRTDTSDYCRRVRDRAQEIGSVQWVDDLSQAQLALEYQRAWVFTCASLFEGFGMPFLEAEACGVPCVGFDVCSVPEVVSHGQSGLLVPPGDVAALADAIDELLSSPARREEMSAAAGAKADTFGWPRSAQIICDAMRGYRA